jgi:hypothetical protein
LVKKSIYIVAEAENSEIGKKSRRRKRRRIFVLPRPGSIR